MKGKTMEFRRNRGPYNARDGKKWDISREIVLFSPSTDRRDIFHLLSMDYLGTNRKHSEHNVLHSSANRMFMHNRVISFITLLRVLCSCSQHSLSESGTRSFWILRFASRGNLQQHEPRISLFLKHKATAHKAPSVYRKMGMLCCCSTWSTCSPRRIADRLFDVRFECLCQYARCHRSCHGWYFCRKTYCHLLHI